MRGVPNPELKAECIRLRDEERMSLREIHQKTGASKGSLSSWLKDFPLTAEEKADRARKQKRYQAPKKERGKESVYHQMLSGKPLTCNEKAKISEAAVLHRVVVQRFNVFGSPFDGDRADWVVEADGKLLRVQVKWASKVRQGLPVVSLSHNPTGRKKRRYTREDFDFIVGYDLFTDTCYVWSFDETENHKATISVCPKAAERWDKMRSE